FNLFAIAVERRRRDIGVLRAMGATPRQIAGLFLTEAAVLGAVASGAGVLVGALVADRTSRLIAATVELTQGVSDAATPVVSVRLAVTGVLVGIAASLSGAWWPSRRAARTAPADAMATGVFSA